MLAALSIEDKKKINMRDQNILKYITVHKK